MTIASSTLIAPTEIQRYLHALFPDPPDDAWLVISWLAIEKTFHSRWFLVSQEEDITACIVQHAQTSNVYVGLGLRYPHCTPSSSTRGTSDDVFAIGGLWVELDHNRGIHAARNLPSREELLEFLASLPMAFSLLVDSGGGIHAYLLFKELLIFDTPEERGATALLLRRFQRTIKLWAGKHHWKVDSTADLARVLRPAGTINYKGPLPLPVRILDEHPIRYDPSEIAEAHWLATIDEIDIPSPQDGSYPVTLLEPIMQQCAWLRHTHDDAATLPEPEWYAMLGIVGRCEGGTELAHEWSEPYSGYTAEETKQKLQHALQPKGSRKCSSIRYDLNAEEYCGNCIHWGSTIKAPIALGMPPITPSTPDDPFGTGLPTVPHMHGTAPSTTGHVSRLPSRIAIPIIITMDSVIAQPIEWLWWPYLAIGTLAMLDGDPGIGKSLLTSQLAASLSRGWPLPNQQGVPEGHAISAHSLFMAREDSLAFIVRKRLDELQADVSKIHYLTGWRGAEDEEYAFTLADMDVLAQGLERHRPRLVVIDPIQGYLGAKVDINRANETRPLLDKLSSIAEAYGCTILCVRHPAKASGQSGGKAMLRGLGSVDFIGAARTGIFVEQHPFQGDLALMAMSKSNIGPKGRTHIFSKADGVFSWAGVTRMDAEILAGSGRGPDPRAFLEAYLWLEKRLEGGIAVPATDVEAQAEQEIDASVKILRRAKKMLGVISKQESYGWSWKLSSLSLSLTTRPPASPGSTGSTGSTGISDVFKGYEPYGKEDTPIDSVTPEDPEDPVNPVLSRDAHDAGAHESKIMPDSQVSRCSLLMAWDACPQCKGTNWAPDTGAPLVCLACGYVAE